MDVSIVIVHYNTPELTANCIDSILQKTVGLNYEIIVVDNALTVHDAQELKDSHPQICLVKSDQNLGFAKGNNLGIQHASGKYILLLNSDTVLHNNAIKIAYDYLEMNKEVGVVSAQLLFPDGRVQSCCQRFSSIRYKLIELLRLQKLMSKKKRGEVLLGAFFDHKAPIEADWVWGTFFFFRKEILNLLPGNKLDENYFMYVEDIQWCWDIKKLGFKVHFYPEAKVIHYMGGSSADKTSLLNENYKKFLEKNYHSIHREIISSLEKILSR